MAASLGVPAMLVFVYFLISLGIRCVWIMRAGDRLLFQGAWYIPLILLYMLIVDMFEPMLFTSQRVNLPFFYMMAGWIVALDKRYFTDSGFRLTPGKE
jgi:small-conductance mechanosensitive channel